MGDLDNTVITVLVLASFILVPVIAGFLSAPSEKRAE